MKKIIVTGGTGFFGLNWFNFTKKKYLNILLKNKKNLKLKNLVKIDLTNPILLKKKILKINPNIIIHAAAQTNLDIPNYLKIKETKDQIKIIKNLKRICNQYKILLIFISSDQLYNGKKSIYNERDKYSPINWYSKSKVLCENEVKKIKKFVIIRTNFFGWAPKNRKSFSDFILFNKKKEIILYENIYYTPILIDYLIQGISKIIDKKIYGIFNICSSEKLSKYEFGTKMIKIFKLKKIIIKKDKYSQSYKNTPRPYNMSLDNRKFLKLGFKIPSLDFQIKKMYLEYKKKKYYKIRYSY